MTAGEARALGRTAADAPDPVGEAHTLGDTVDAAVTDTAAAEEEVTCGVEVRALGETTVIDNPGKIVAGVADSEVCAAAEFEVADDTDAANAGEETCGEARALVDPVEAANTTVDAAEEDTCRVAREQDESVEAADTDAFADLSSDKGYRTLRNSRRSHRCTPLANS